MEKRVVSDYIKGFVFDNIDRMEGLSGDNTEDFIKRFNVVVDENEDEIYFRMLKIREEINKEMLDLGKCDEYDFKNFLKHYSAVFVISKKYFYISYVGIFNDEDLEYPKFDEEIYSQFSSGVNIPLMM